MSIGLQRQEGGGQVGHRQVAAGPDWVHYHADHRHRLAGQACWVPGRQHRPTGAREQRTSTALALATGPSLAQQAYSMVQRAACACVRAVPSGYSVTHPLT